MNPHAPATSPPPTGPSPRRAYPSSLPSTHTGCICLSDAYVPGHAIALLNRLRAAEFCTHASVPVPPASTVPEARTHTVVTVLESDMEGPQKLREARICSRAQVQNETGDPIRGPALSPANSYGGKPAKIPVLGGGKSNTAMCPQISGNTDLVDFLGTPHEHRAQIALAPLRSPFVFCVCACAGGEVARRE